MARRNIKIDRPPLISERAAEVIVDALGVIGCLLVALALFAACGVDGEGWLVALAIFSASILGACGCYELAVIIHDLYE